MPNYSGRNWESLSHKREREKGKSGVEKTGKDGTYKSNYRQRQTGKIKREFWGTERGLSNVDGLLSFW